MGNPRMKRPDGSWVETSVAPVHRIYLDELKQDSLDYRQGSGDTVEIFDIVVGSERRQGRGRRLLEALFARLPETVTTVFAITRADNLIAQLWYEAMQFEVCGTLRRFYNRTKPVVDGIMYARSPKGPV